MVRLKREDIIDVPDELAFLEFFCREPVIQEPSNGFWRYEAQVGQVSVGFSFDIFERSIQTEVLVGGVLVARVAHEDAREIQVKAGGSTRVLRAAFYDGTTLCISLHPAVLVEWATLYDAS